MADDERDLFEQQTATPADQDDDPVGALASSPSDDEPEDSTASEDDRAPYRGGWKDDNGMCSASCPALSEQACRGFATKFFDCLVTGYRVDPGVWPCEIRSIWEAVKRGPEV